MCVCALCVRSASLAKELLSTHPRVLKWMVHVATAEEAVERAVGSRFMGSPTARRDADDAVAEVMLLLEVGMPWWVGVVHMGGVFLRGEGGRGWCLHACTPWVWPRAHACACTH